MNVVFMGTPEFAVPTLGELAGHGHSIVAVYTRAPAESGRGLKSRPSPVHRMADRLGIPVHHPRSLRSDEAVARLAGLEADLVVVVAYGMILPEPVLAVPRLGCLNLHASLLPRWRGAAPIQRAVMAGDAETGVAVMRMEAGLDTGPVAMQERVAIRPDMTAGDLHDMLASVGADLMGRAVAALGRGSLEFLPQASDGVTYARKIEKGECRIDWGRPAAEVSNQIRGLSPFPGAFFESDLGHGPERVKALRCVLGDAEGEPGTVLDGGLTVACQGGSVRLTRVQRAGKEPLDAAEFLLGALLPPGTRLAAA